MISIEQAQSAIPDFQSGWRSKLRDASFRGVPFKVSTVTSSFGRRVKEVKRWQKHSVTVDEGPEIDEFVIEGYIIQERQADGSWDYFDNRDALIAALKKGGNNVRESGILVHPFMGEIPVHVKGRVAFTESFSEGQGIARFTATFCQEGPSKFPGAKPDYVKNVDDIATTTKQITSDNFFDKFLSNIFTANTVLDDVTKTMQNIQTSVNSVRTAIESTMTIAVGIMAGTITLVADLLDQPCDLVDAILDTADAYKYLTGELGDTIVSGVTGPCSNRFSGTPTTLDGKTVPENLGISVCQSMVNAADFSSVPYTEVTGSSATNRVTIQDATKAGLYTNATTTAIRIDYSSQDKMFEILDLIVAALDAFLLELGNNVLAGAGPGGTDTGTEGTGASTGTEVDGISGGSGNMDLYNAMDDLRSTFISSMIGKNTGLAKSIEYIEEANVKSTLELAYDKYEDLDRESDIFSRNRALIQHPSFVPGGETLNLLDDFI